MYDWEIEELEEALREAIASGEWKVSVFENWREVVRAVTIETD